MMASLNSHSISTTVRWVVAVTLFSVTSVNARCSDANGPFCTELCTCTTTKVDCSHGNMSEIPPKLPPTVEELLLNNNDIHTLTATDLAGCTSLMTLDLSFNNLTSIDRAAFVETVSLSRLYLSSNKIVVSRLANETFDRLRNLLELRIDANNWWADGNKPYHGRLFAELTSLQLLSMDGLPDQHFPAEFSHLINLDNLQIAGGINRITNETFATFNNSRIRYLTIASGVHLRSVEPLSFAHFRQMENLTLNENYNLGFENVSKAWYGLQMTNISVLALRSITNTANAKPQRITEDFFRYLNQTKIKVLILSANSLVHIQPNFSTYLPYLTFVSLAGNWLYYPKPLVDDFAKLQYLETLYTSYQYCSPTSPNDVNAFFDKTNGKLIKRDQQNKEIDVKRCNTYENVSCKSVHAGRNSKSMRSIASTKTMLPVCIPLSPNVTTLYINDGLYVFRQALPPLTITEGGGKLKFVELSDNGLRDINGPIIFTDPPQNLFVGLSFNQIECLHWRAFEHSYKAGAKITGLNLTANNLGVQLQRDKPGLTFTYFPFLEVLLLDYNGIKQLHNKTFQNLTELRTLSLFGNALKEIEFEFDHMRKLTFLDLSLNGLTFLSEAIRKKLETAFDRNENFSMALEGNPLQCSCETWEFLRWINRHRDNFNRFEAYSCFFSGQYVNFSMLEDYILEELEYDCSKSLVVIISGLLLGVVLVLVTLSIICYRNRWEIRYVFIKLTQRGQRYQELYARTVRYNYDAFVVYDSSDRQWVKHELLPHLEEPHAAATTGGEGSDFDEFARRGHTGLRLCVHERDFRPGEDIIGNIWEKMEKSRKVILVISKTFAKSYYCDYEMNLARMQSVEMGRNIIVPVLLGMPDIDGITDCLYWVLRKVTYLEWPQNEEQQSEFWEKLRRTIIDGDDDND